MMPFDIAIIGIVFALILLVIFFSAVVLYLAFRIKETFRKETKRGATVAKIAFLIGILFFAGGIFYFFANTLTNITEPTPTPTFSPSPSPTISPYPSPSPSPSSTVTPTPTNGPLLNLVISYPSMVTTNSQITMSFTITNPTDSTAHGTAIQTSVLFGSFTIQSSTHEVVGNVIDIGDVPPGTTIVSLELLAPDKPEEVDDTITLVFQEMDQPITKEISISVRGGQ